MNAKEAESRVIKYTFLKTKIIYYNKKIQLINNELRSITSTSFEEIKNRDTNDKKEKLIDKKIMLEKEIKNMELESKFIEEAINVLDKRDKEIIIDFYVHKLSINVIAQKQRYSSVRIRQLKQIALEKLGKYLD